MQQLLDDPQTLPFKKGKHISLKILKKEIDRRIAKIRHMLGQQPTHRKHSKNKIDFACQTTQPWVETILENNNQNILTSNSSIFNSADSTSSKRKSSKRCSLPVNKNKHKKQQTMDCSHHKNKTKLSQYLSGIKSKDDYEVAIYNDDRFEEDEKKFVQTSAQEDNVFSSHDFQHFLERPSHTFKTALHFDNSDEQSDDSLTSDQEASIIYHKRLSNIGLKARSLKKIKFTDRTAPDSEYRVIVGKNCMERMEQLVSSLIPKKRRELRDTKIRENIIKKIDEKYGDHVGL